MFSDILLAVDFDRTLTAPDSSIPERNLTAIRYFTENGGAFTVNTGRSVAMFKRYMDLIGANVPYLLYNGSAAYDHKTGELSMLMPMEMDLETTMEEVRQAFPHMNVELQGINAHYCFQNSGDWHGFYNVQICEHLDAAPGLDYGPFLKFCIFGTLKEPTVSHMFTATKDEMVQMDQAEEWIRRKYGDKIDVFRAAPRMLDVHARGVSKINAARALQKQLGRKLLVCVGDAENDIPMLDGADFAYVPGDARLKDCYETVCDCGEGAVADVIYKKIPEILGIKP